MEPITFHGEAFSECFCTKLIWSDPQLGPRIDQQAAEETYKKVSTALPDMFDLPVPGTKKIRKSRSLENIGLSSNIEWRIYI